MLRTLLETAKDTQFGEKYNFKTILLSDDICESFADVVPYLDYNKIIEKWWNIISSGD